MQQAKLDPGAHLGNRAPVVQSPPDDVVIPASATSPGLVINTPVRTMRPGEIRRHGVYAPASYLPVNPFDGGDD